MVRLSLLLLITIPVQLFSAHASTADTVAQAHASQKLQDKCITYLVNNFSRFDHESIGFSELDPSDLQCVLSGAVNDRRNALDICRYKEECPERLLRTAELVSGETFVVDENNKLDTEFVIDELQLTDPELLNNCAKLRSRDIDKILEQSALFKNPIYRRSIFTHYAYEYSHFVWGFGNIINLTLRFLVMDPDTNRKAYYRQHLKEIFDNKRFSSEESCKKSFDSNTALLFQQFVDQHKLLMVERISRVLVRNERQAPQVSQKYLAGCSIDHLRVLWRMAIKISIANSKNDVSNLVYELYMTHKSIFVSGKPIVEALKEFLEVKVNKFSDPDDE